MCMIGVAAPLPKLIVSEAAPHGARPAKIARATSSIWTKSPDSSPSSKIGNDSPSRIRVEKIDRGAGVGVLQRIPFAIDVLETQHGRLNAQ